MFHRNRILLSKAVLITLVVALVTPTSASTAATMKACVNKKSGVMRMITKGSCKSTEKKVEWNIRGEQGLPGPVGATGATGAAGATGPAGSNGLPGSAGAAGVNGKDGTSGSSGAKGASTLTGVGAPANSLGENGDTYIDKNSAMIYGPKTNGVWGYGTSFAGPAGARGPAGEQGPAGTAEGDSFLIRGLFGNVGVLLNSFETPTVAFTRSFEPGKYLFEFKFRYISRIPVPALLVCTFQDVPTANVADAFIVPPSLADLLPDGYSSIFSINSSEVSFSQYLELTSEQSTVDVSCALFSLFSDGNWDAFGEDGAFGVILYSGEMKALSISNLINVEPSPSLAPTSISSSTSTRTIDLLSRLRR